MAPLPPPSPTPSGPTTDQTARLAELARRRTPAGTTDASSGVDDRAARLERLARRTRPTDTPPASSGTLRRSRRRHPAKGARAAALGMSLATTAGLAGFFATVSRPASPDAAATIVSTGSRSLAPSDGDGATARTVDLGVPASDGSTTDAAANGGSGPIVVDGAVFHNRWGDVQVEATFAPDGSLSSVVALRAPDDRGKSVRINEYAVPRLTQEALQVQTADVHTVSGATYTSDGYRSSLQSAIDAARSAGLTAMT
jgi:hypothetical protein